MLTENGREVRAFLWKLGGSGLSIELLRHSIATNTVMSINLHRFVAEIEVIPFAHPRNEGPVAADHGHNYIQHFRDQSGHKLRIEAEPCVGWPCGGAVGVGFRHLVGGAAPGAAQRRLRLVSAGNLALHPPELPDTLIPAPHVWRYCGLLLSLAGILATMQPAFLTCRRESRHLQTGLQPSCCPLHTVT